jgi:mono/diheme cytochrome c family protein
MRSSILALCAALGTVAAVAVPLMAVQDQPHPTVSVQSKGAPSGNSKSPEVKDEGERVFKQNCARCHNSPNGFSSRITGTIVRHMRVRANLSSHDEQALLKFFNQ